MRTIRDRKFLENIQAMMAEPGSEDIAVTYMAEVGPGLFVARERDGEVLVYVNLEVYKQNPDFHEFDLRERNAMPENIGAVQNVLCRSLQGIIDLTKQMVVLKDGGPPDYYDTPVVVS